MALSFCQCHHPQIRVQSNCKPPHLAPLQRKSPYILILRRPDISADGQKYPLPWLRDACQCPECVHPSTRQKLFRSSDIPVDIQGLQDVNTDGLKVRWSNGHESVYSWDFLRAHSPSTMSRNGTEANKELSRVAWTRADIIKERDLFLDYGELQGNAGLKKAIDHYCKFGLLFVRNVPNKETSTVSCHLRIFANLFSEIRTTFYGELWDVKNIANSRNIAYTNLDLGLHMDLLFVSTTISIELLVQSPDHSSSESFQVQQILPTPTPNPNPNPAPRPRRLLNPYSPTRGATTRPRSKIQDPAALAFAVLQSVQTPGPIPDPLHKRVTTATTSTSTSTTRTPP